MPLVLFHNMSEILLFFFFSPSSYFFLGKQNYSKRALHQLWKLGRQHHRETCKTFFYFIFFYCPLSSDCQRFRHVRKTGNAIWRQIKSHLYSNTERNSIWLDRVVVWRAYRRHDAYAKNAYAKILLSRLKNAPANNGPDILIWETNLICLLCEHGVNIKWETFRLSVPPSVSLSF